MDEPTCSQPVTTRDAASCIINLPGYDVIGAVGLPIGGRRVVVQVRGQDEGCLDWVVSTLHSWTRQRAKDLPVGGTGLEGVVEVVVRKPRWVCAEKSCGRRTVVQVTDQLRSGPLPDPATRGGPRRGGRLGPGSRRSRVGVQRRVVDRPSRRQRAVMTLPEVDDIAVLLLGIDEHRFRTVNFFRDDHGAWRRVEPWMTTS